MNIHLKFYYQMTFRTRLKDFPEEPIMLQNESDRGENGFSEQKYHMQKGIILRFKLVC